MREAYQIEYFDQLSVFNKLKLILIGTLALWQAIYIGLFLFEVGVLFTFVHDVSMPIVIVNVTLGIAFLFFNFWYNSEIKTTRAIIYGVIRDQVVRENSGSDGQNEALVALKSGRLLDALELFMSRYNYAATIVTTKPFYRMVGGKKSPFLSTILTFIYTGLFVHPLLPYVIRLAPHSIYLLGFWVILGLLIALNKLYREILKTAHSH